MLVSCNFNCPVGFWYHRYIGARLCRKQLSEPEFLQDFQDEQDCKNKSCLS